MKANGLQLAPRTIPQSLYRLEEEKATDTYFEMG
jgi:hypothetical protein